MALSIAACSTDSGGAGDSTTIPPSPPPISEPSATNTSASEEPASGAPASDPPNPDEPSATTPPPAGDSGTGGASAVLPVVSLFYLGEVITGDVERDLGELTRCVADGLDASGPPASPLTLDPGADPDDLIASLDPALVSAIADAMDACISPVVLFTDAFDDGSIEREQHWRARCLIEAIGGLEDWAEVIAAFQAGDFEPFGDTRDAEAACGELPGAEESLTADEDAAADSLDELADIVGFELTRDEINCILVGSRDGIEPGLTIDLEAPDFDALAPVLEALDACVPLGGLLAEFDDGAIVYSMCLDRELAGSVGWRELAELGVRADDLTDAELAADPLIVAVDAARARCLSSEPGEVLAELGEVLEVEVLVHDGTRLWAGGIDEHGGASPGNVLVLDGSSGEVVTAIETEPFSVEIITVDGDAAWIASADGEVVQRVHAPDGSADAPVELPGRAIGDLQLTTEALWATDNTAGSLLRLDRETGEVLDEIAVAPGDWYSSDLAIAAESLWLTNREDPIVRQLDPATGELAAGFTLESEFTMHLVDLGDAVGVYGFSELWRIDPTGDGPERLIDTFGVEELDIDAAVSAVDGHIAYADEDISMLAFFDPASEFIEEMRFFPGTVAGERDRMVSDGTTIWLVTFNDLLVRFDP